MLTYESELSRLRDTGVLRADAAERLIAMERRERFSVYWEIRLAAYVAVLMIATGVGIFVKNHFEDIGPLAIVAAISVAAAGCYAFSYARLRRGSGESAAADYVLLLAALLLSADVGFAESQYHFLGDAWPRHFLLLAVVHAATAYYFRSRIVLSVAITSFAAWLGIERNIDAAIHSAADFGLRALLCAAVIFAWRYAHRRRSAIDEFVPVFDHAMTNFAMWGSVLWCFAEDLRWLGLVMLAAFAYLALRRAFARREEVFALYGGIYFYIGASAVIVHIITQAFSGDTEAALIFIYFLATIPAIVTALSMIHLRFRRSR